MRILVIGCGSIGQRHAGNAAALGADVCVFDVLQESAKNAAEALKLKSFDTLESAFAWQPHGVIVASPHTTHVALAAQALQAGADVLIEKPISNNLEGVEALIQEAKEKRRQISVVCNMRYHEAIMALREHLDELGRLLYAQAHYGNYLPNMRPGADYRTLYSAKKASGGGVILDVIHEVDYLIWLLGGVSTVDCKADKISGLDIDVEDYANINLTHHSGTHTNINIDFLKPFKRRGCEIVGENGMIIWQSEGKAPEKCVVKLFRNTEQKWVNLVDNDNVDANAAYIRLIQAFMVKIDNPNVETNLSDGSEGLEALKVALKARETARIEGKRIE